MRAEGDAEEQRASSAGPVPGKLQFPFTLSSAAPGSRQLPCKQAMGGVSPWYAGWENTPGQRFGAAHSFQGPHLTLQLGHWCLEGHSYLLPQE